MATSIIPTRTDGTQRYTVRLLLDGLNFGLEFFWNPRELAWYVLLYDANGNQLLVRKLVGGQPLTQSFGNQALPRGELLVIDTTGKDQDPGLTDLGARVLLTYIPQSDLPS